MEKKVYYKQIFFFLMAITSVSFFLVLIFTGGYSMRGLLSSDTEGTFMDFANGVLMSLGKPYENGSTLSPLLLAFYRLFAFLVPTSLLSQIGWSENSISFSTNIKLYQGFWFIFIIYSVIFIAALYFLITNEKRGEKLERIAFCVLIFVSSPVLFILERGNSAIITVSFLLFFISFRNSENKLLKELSVISLAIASGLNPLCVLFSILLIKKGTWLNFLKFFIYFLILFISPFFLFGGLSSLVNYFTNVYEKVITSALTAETQLNFTNIFIPFLNGNFASAKLVTIGKISRIVLSTIAVAGCIISKKPYQKAIFASVFAYGLSSTSETTELVYMIIPIIMLLNEEKDSHISAYGAISLMTLSIAPIVSMDLSTNLFTRRFITLVSSWSVVLLTIFLFIMSVLEKILRIDSKET